MSMDTASMSGHLQVKASVLHGAKDLRIETRSLPAPAPTELQIAVRSTGLCGSDLHYYNHFRNGDIICLEPMSLGHESAGVVVAVGSGVHNFHVGDKVALEVGLSCQKCALCKQGRYNICKKMSFRSSAKAYPHAQGTLQERINHPAAWCHKLPQSLSLDLGAILEPLGVAIHANRRASLPPSSTVLVFGAGAVGLLVAAVAKTSGCRTVVIADIDAGRVNFAVQNRFADSGFVVPMRKGKDTDEDLAIAKDLASDICNVAKAGKGEEPLEEVDAVFECTGVPSCLQAAIYATRPGGRIMLIGMGTPVQTIPLSAAALREVDLVGVFRYANTYPMGIEIVSKHGEGYPDFTKLVTHRYHGLENTDEAFKMAARTQDDQGNLVIKVILEVSNDIAKL